MTQVDKINLLIDILVQSRACFLNLMPDSGPMCRQMSKMIDEINTALDTVESEDRHDV